MGLFGDLFDGFSEMNRFKDTVFLKESSGLQKQHEALSRLASEFPDNEEIAKELIKVKKGLEGEKEIAYRLGKASIGMYVLHDVRFVYEDLTAQVDYIVVTPVFTYFIECKNMIGNITVTEKGDFIREYSYNGKRVKKGMNSPLTQVEDQREVYRKIWEDEQTGLLSGMLASYNFYHYRRVLVVAANPDTILNTSKAPFEWKHKILRADALVRQIEYDIDHRADDDAYDNQKEMKKTAEAYLRQSAKDEDKDYYAIYRDKYCPDSQPAEENGTGGSESVESDASDLRERLIAFRTQAAKAMKIPPYYVFNNEELERLIAEKPKTVEELKQLKILPPVKIKVHGEGIVGVIAND